MKRTILYLAGIFLIIITAKLNSQTIKIETTQISYEDQLRPCMTNDLDPTPKEVKKAWSKFLDKNYDIDVSGIGWFSDEDILIAKDVTIGDISEKRINLYSRILEKGNGSEIKVFASFGYDFFIGEDNYPKEFKSLNELFYKFLFSYLSEYYSDMLEETSDKIDDNNKEKVSLLKSIEKNKDKIEDAKEDIAELNSEKPETNE